MKSVFIIENPENPAPPPDALAQVPVAGIVRFSTLDYPGKLAAVLFTQGCPWRCAYCHNTHLQPLTGGKTISPEALRLFLRNRRGLLDAVVISGGEPTLHPGLAAFSKAIAGLGFAVGLHTNGMNPERLRTLLPLCRWVGMDVKAPRPRYKAVTAAEAFEKVERSAGLLITSPVDYELRMTYHPSLLTEREVLETAEHFSRMGAKRFVLQVFRKRGCPDETLCFKSPSPSGDLSRALLEKLTGLFSDFAVREG